MSLKTPVLRIVASVSANHQSIKEDVVVGMLLSLRKISFYLCVKKKKTACILSVLTSQPIQNFHDFKACVFPSQQAVLSEGTPAAPLLSSNPV